MDTARTVEALGEGVCRTGQSRSDVAQHDLARTPPANRDEVTHPAADHEPCRITAMTQEAVGVENRTGKQAVSILAGDDLAAVQVSGQDEVVAGMAACSPDVRVVRAQDADMPIARANAASGPEIAITRSPCVTCAVPSWIQCPPPCSTASRTRSRPMCRSWLPPIASTAATSCSSSTRSLSLPNSEAASTRSPPSSTTSGWQPATAATTCGHRVSERPSRRWMSLTYSSRHASCCVGSRSSRTCRARCSPISNPPPDHGHLEAGRCRPLALGITELPRRYLWRRSIGPGAAGRPHPFVSGS